MLLNIYTEEKKSPSNRNMTLHNYADVSMDMLANVSNKYVLKKIETKRTKKVN